MQSISSPSQQVVRHNTREHAQLNNTFLSTTSFGSQSPGGAAGATYSNNFDSFLEGVMTEEVRVLLGLTQVKEEGVKLSI
jgi:hypothetical protein